MEPSPIPAFAGMTTRGVSFPMNSECSSQKTQMPAFAGMTILSGIEFVS
jgi:hypothetical protein